MAKPRYGQLINVLAWLRIAKRTKLSGVLNGCRGQAKVKVLQRLGRIEAYRFIERLQVDDRSIAVFEGQILADRFHHELVRVLVYVHRERLDLGKFVFQFL